MPHNDLEEALQPSPPLFNHRVVEAVEVDLPRQRRDGDARGFPLEQVAEDLEVGVPPPHLGAPELEGRDVGREADEVGGVARGGRGGGLVGLGVGYLSFMQPCRQLHPHHHHQYLSFLP